MSHALNQYVSSSSLCPRILVNRPAVQLLEDEPWEALKPVLEELIADKEQDKQRAAAEFLAGVLNGEFSEIS